MKQIYFKRQERCFRRKRTIFFNSTINFMTDIREFIIMILSLKIFILTSTWKLLQQPSLCWSTLTIFIHGKLVREAVTSLWMYCIISKVEWLMYLVARHVWTMFSSFVFLPYSYQPMKPLSLFHSSTNILIIVLLDFNLIFFIKFSKVCSTQHSSNLFIFHDFPPTYT